MTPEVAEYEAKHRYELLELFLTTKHGCYSYNSFVIAQYQKRKE